MALGGSAWATFRGVTGMPVDRLVENLGQRIAEHPKDAHLQYLLGRVHSYAFALNSRLVPALDKGDGDIYVQNPPEAERFLARSESWEKNLAQAAEKGTASDETKAELAERRALSAQGQFSETERLAHLVGGVQGHLRALALDPAPPEYHLGLAYVLEQGAADAPKLAEDPMAYASTEPAVGDEPMPLPQTRVAAWLERAEAESMRAFELTAQSDLDLGRQPFGESGLRDAMSYEAALSVLRLMQGRPAKKGDAELAARMNAHMKAVSDLPEPRMVTPIVFSLAGAPSLDALLCDRTAVFDLDGDGRAEPWPWLQPDTALLVWDPDHTGTITSGLQLFGSVTWWLFPRDGYQALDLLDDDGDGWLSGAELSGLGIWQDRNGDGVSASGEVTPIDDTGIVALSTRATGSAGRSLVSEHGLRLRDGRQLPTYDWVTTPAVEP